MFISAEWSGIYSTGAYPFNVSMKGYRSPNRQWFRVKRQRVRSGQIAFEAEMRATCRRRTHGYHKTWLFIRAEVQSRHLTETFLPFLHLLNCWNSRSTATMQLGAAWSTEQLSAGRLGSGFVNGRTIQHGDRGRMKRREEHRSTKHMRRSKKASYLLLWGEQSCMYRQMQASNDGTTKRCFPFTAHRPFHRTGHLISTLTCDWASEKRGRTVPSSQRQPNHRGHNP